MKHKGWEKEAEWRFLVETPDGKDMFSPKFEALKKLGGQDRKFPYPKTAIKSICLGNSFFAPEELNKTDDTALDIKLSDNIDKKVLLLDYMCNNSIATILAVRQPNLKSLGFVNGKLKKCAENHYIFQQIQIEKK